MLPLSLLLHTCYQKLSLEKPVPLATQRFALVRSQILGVVLNETALRHTKIGKEKLQNSRVQEPWLCTNFLSATSNIRSRTITSVVDAAKNECIGLMLQIRYARDGE